MNPITEAIRDYDKGQKTFGEVMEVYKQNHFACICGEYFEDEYDLKKHKEKCSEAFEEENPETCTQCQQNEKANGMDICSSCDRGGDPNDMGDR